MEKTELRPEPGPQTSFLSSPADIVLYGGAAGGGKTWGILADPMRYISVPGFMAVTFRRTRPEITRAGSLWDESTKLYPLLGGAALVSKLAWYWPHGVRHEFGCLEHDQDLESWRGAQIAQLQFDELTTFTKKQFLFLLSRNRTTCGVRTCVRATCNPDPDSWVLELVNWFLDAEGYPDLERCGTLRWFVVDNGVFVWADSPKELLKQYPDRLPKSFTFIPASLKDNSHLGADYRSNLQSMEDHDRLRLEQGNWFARRRGNLYDRSMFKVVEKVPARFLHKARYWDFAATKEDGANDPDFTAAVKVASLEDGSYIVLDAFEDRWEPEEVESTFKSTAKADDRSTKVCWEEEGGSSGKMVSASLTKMLRGWEVEGIRSTGSKAERAKPALGQARAKNVLVLAGKWNDKFFQRMESFGGSGHDDMADAFHGAFNDCVANTKGLPAEVVLVNRTRRRTIMED